MSQPEHDADYESRIERVTEALRLYEQKRKRLRAAEYNALSTDPLHLDYDAIQAALRHARTNFDASEYWLAEIIVKGGSE